MSKPKKEFLVVTTGGTIDALPRVRRKPYEFLPHGKTHVTGMLKNVNLLEKCDVKMLPPIDSKDANAEYRGLIGETLEKSDLTKVIVTHGTDTIVTTGNALAKMHLDKTIGLVGAFVPYAEHGLKDQNGRLIESDATFNLGAAFANVNVLPTGVYVCMNGLAIAHDFAAKSRREGRFRTRGQMERIHAATGFVQPAAAQAYPALAATA